MVLDMLAVIGSSLINFKLSSFNNNVQFTPAYYCGCFTMVRKIPNSLSIDTTSPSVNMNWGLFIFLHCSTIAICWAATDSTGSSIRLNSSKQPQDPDCASPVNKIESCKQYSSQLVNLCTTIHVNQLFTKLQMITLPTLGIIVNLVWSLTFCIASVCGINFALYQTHFASNSQHIKLASAVSFESANLDLTQRKYSLSGRNLQH